jgi:hypothetical protein
VLEENRRVEAQRQRLPKKLRAVWKKKPAPRKTPPAVLRKKPALRWKRRAAPPPHRKPPQHLPQHQAARRLVRPRAGQPRLQSHRSS